MPNTSQQHDTSGYAEKQPIAPTRHVSYLSIIGIGAAAGGVTALCKLFAALPAASGLTFVVVVHLEPAHSHLLAELIRSHTAMPVTQVTGPVTMQLNHVYVIPPAKQPIITDHTLSLTDISVQNTLPLQIDAFFQVLATTHGNGGAIILSGAGGDGAVGIQAIKEQGGLIFVQDPEEAEYDTMPRNAIATGIVDVVAPVAVLAQHVVAAKLTPSLRSLIAVDEALNPADEQILRQVLAHLRLRTGYDFSGYKRTTLLRRLTRRLQLTQMTTLAAYFHRLRQDSDEVPALFRDLLIHITAFFRDPEAWQALMKTVIPQLFVGKSRDDTVRVWSVGCATGEEAYSLAILLLEYADTLPDPPRIQIFASDLSPEALTFARAGIYTQAIAVDVNEERLVRFFTPVNGHYQVRTELRERILFAQHNFLQDPPFSRLDLLVCRNVLIYLERDLQARLFQTFAFALQDGGCLFLGNAESAESAPDLFSSLDKHYRLYHCQRRGGRFPLLPVLSHSGQNQTPAPSALSNRAGEEHRLVLEAAGVPSVLIDRNYAVLHLSNTASPYLVHPGGPLTSDIRRIVRPELALPLRTALGRAFEANKTTTTPPILVQFNGTAHPVYLLVRPHQLADGQIRALVLFLEVETPIPIALSRLTPGWSTDTGWQALETEVQQLHEQLQTVRTEYETTVTNLHLVTEEWQSTSEEYKSTLEELELSKEELQAINEELKNLNQELQTKVDEILQANNDLQNLFAATDIATLFLDTKLRIKRYTPNAIELFHLIPADKERPLTHMHTTLHYAELERDMQHVLATSIPLERDILDQTGHWFLARIRPYQTISNQIAGVVMTFVDITERRSAQAAIHQARDHAEKIVDTVRESLLILTPDLRVQAANAVFYQHFQMTPAETIGHLLYELGNDQWQIPALRTLLEEVFPNHHLFKDFEITHDFPGLGRRILLLNGRQVEHTQLILLALEDITERKQAETALQQLNATLEEQVLQRTAQVRALASALTLAEQTERRHIAQILHDDLQQQLYAIQVKLLSIRPAISTDPKVNTAVQTVQTWLDEAIRITRQLTVDLSPPLLPEDGLTQALEWLTTRITATHGLRVAISAAHAFQLPDKDMQVLLTQLARELLFNIVKHGATDQARIELQFADAGDLQLTVSDHGRGFDMTQAMTNQTGSFGLFSVRERLALFGGRMDILSAPGQGTRITLTVPIATNTGASERASPA